jgi:hypothetical protein
MIGMTLRVEMARRRNIRSTDHLRCRVQVGRSSPTVLRRAVSRKHEVQGSWLGWHGMRSAQMEWSVELFPKWVENVGDITFVPKEKPKQDAQST